MKVGHTVELPCLRCPPSHDSWLSVEIRVLNLVLGSRIERTGLFISDEMPLAWQFAAQMSELLLVEHIIDEEF